MPYNANKFMLPKETLPSLCLDLHMHVTGSSDPLDKDTFVRYVRCLEVAVADWDHTHSATAIFDNAILNLVVATLSEIRLRLSYNLEYKYQEAVSVGGLADFLAGTHDITLYL